MVLRAWTSKKEGTEWYTRVPQSVTVEKRIPFGGKNFVDCFVYWGPSEWKRISLLDLQTVLELDLPFEPESWLPIQSKLGPFKGRLYWELPSRAEFEECSSVWDGYFSLRQALMMLGSIKMSSSEFREHFRVKDIFGTMLEISSLSGHFSMVPTRCDRNSSLADLREEVVIQLARWVSRHLQDQVTPFVEPGSFASRLLPDGVEAIFYEQIRMAAEERRYAKLCSVCRRIFFPKKKSGVDTCSGACRTAKSRGRLRRGLSQDGLLK